MRTANRFTYSIAKGWTMGQQGVGGWGTRGCSTPEVGSSMKTMEGFATSSTAMVNRFRCSTDKPSTPGLPTTAPAKDLNSTRSITCAMQATHCWAAFLQQGVAAIQLCWVTIQSNHHLQPRREGSTQVAPPHVKGKRHAFGQQQIVSILLPSFMAITTNSQDKQASHSMIAQVAASVRPFMAEHL